MNYGLVINKTKCVECLFFPKVLPKYAAKYLGVHFFSYKTWSSNIDTVFTKCLKLSFCIRVLGSINVYKCLLWEIVSTLCYLCNFTMLHDRLPRISQHRLYLFYKMSRNFHILNRVRILVIPKQEFNFSSYLRSALFIQMLVQVILFCRWCLTSAYAFLACDRKLWRGFKDRR